MLSRSIHLVPRMAATRALSTTPAALSSSAKARDVIESIPQTSVATKAGLLAAATGALVFGFSKELIIYHPESLVLACFAGITYLGITKGGKDIAATLDERATDLKRQLSTAHEANKAAVATRIEEIKGYSGAVEITKQLFEASREIAALKAQVSELEVRQKLVADIKSKLDYLVVVEAKQRSSEQAKILEHLRARINAAIADPKFQETILKKCVSDIEGMSLKQ